MAKLDIKYRLEGKALPPRPIKVAIGDWGGSAENRKENGSEPEPWHCPAFVDGCTHGFELLYQYDTECHVLNVNGVPTFQWSQETEPGGVDPRNDFTLSNPPPPTEYLFITSIDIQVPPGYVLRVEPHPRYFRDMTFTVPACHCGHLLTEWWPKRMFMVFKAPPPGHRHIFRKGDPYAQVLVIPRDQYVLQPMTSQERAKRLKLEEDIWLTKSLIAKRVWNSSSGVEFNDHYNVLLRAFERQGIEGVEAVVREGVAEYHRIVPEGKTIPEYLELAKKAAGEKEFVAAKELLHRVLKLDPRNAEVYAQMAVLNWEQKVPKGAVVAMRQAVALQPNSTRYRMTLADLYRRVNRPDLAQREIEAAFNLSPNDPQILISLGMILADRGMTQEAIDRCKSAASIDPKSPLPHYSIGIIHAKASRRDEAKAAFEAALAIDPNFTPARQSLEQMGG